MPSQAETRAESTAQSTPPLALSDIHNKAIIEAPGVTLSDQERLVVGSILDLYEGKGSTKHLSLWSGQACHACPAGILKGYREYVAIWYVHATWSESIQMQSHMVTSRGNPIRLKLSNKYISKGIKMEKIIDSEIEIHLDKDGQVERLEEHWVTVRSEGARPAQGPQGQGPWGALWWVWTRMSDWCWWALCTDTYWWASWPWRRASGFLVTECTRAVQSVEDWDFSPKGEQKKNI